MQQKRLMILVAALVAVIGVSAVAYNRLGANSSARLMNPGAGAAAEASAGTEQSRPDIVDAEGELDAGSGEADTAEEPMRFQALDFTMYDAEGAELRLSDLYGKPIVLNFWASWCPPCKQEMPEFNEVWQEKGDEIQFVMVDLTDGAQETMDKGLAHIEEMGYGFPVYFDLDQEAAYTYRVTSIPTTYFIDAEGYLVTGAVGMINKATLLEAIDLISADATE